MFEQEKVNGWPGLSKEVSQICDNIGIPDVNYNFVPTNDIKDAISGHHYADMKGELEKDIKHEDFRKPQGYMEDRSIENGRCTFRICSKMVDSFPANFKNKFRNDPEGLICIHCSSRKILSQNHCLVCPAWGEIKEGLDLRDIKDLVTFFRRLLVEREKVEDGKA